MTYDGDIEDSLADGQIIDTAIDLTGTGRFTIKIVIIGALIILNASFVTTSISLIIPAAACDFDLNTLDQGILTAIPFLGMIFGSYFYGCLADLSGRKRALMISLITQGLFEGLCAVVSNYWGFLILKLLSGFSLIAQNVVGYPYISEFLPLKIRGRILCGLEVAWIIGMMVLPGAAWIIMPLEVSYVTDHFIFHSWSLFVLLYSLLAPALAMWLAMFPETPKYLADIGDDAKLAGALRVMHSENTGLSFDEYLVSLTNHKLGELRVRLETREVKKHCNAKSGRITQLCRDMLTNTAKLLRPPFLKQTVLICGLMFCMGSTSFSFSLWFPELIRRLENFEDMFPGESSWICTSFPGAIAANETDDRMLCSSEIPEEVYMQTLIIAASSLLPNIVVPIWVDKVGYKFFIVAYSAAAFAVTAGLFFVQSSMQNLIVSSLYEAFTSVGIAVVLVVITELYPTHIRATAAAFGMILGRIGGITGNLLIGYLIDYYCTSFIIITMAQLLVCVILGFILPMEPKKGKAVPEVVESTL